MTEEQLGALVAGLGLPARSEPGAGAGHDLTSVTLLTAAQALCTFGLSSEASTSAVGRFGQKVSAGRGWLVLSGSGDEWSPWFASVGPDLIMTLRAHGGCGVVLDLDAVATAAEGHWRAARSPA